MPWVGVPAGRSGVGRGAGGWTGQGGENPTGDNYTTTAHPLFPIIVHFFPLTPLCSLSFTHPHPPTPHTPTHAAQQLRERPNLAASPAAAAYDAAASAPAPATTAARPAAPFHASSPGPSPHKLAEIGPHTGAAAGDSIYNILKAQADASKGAPEFTFLAALVDKAGLAGTLSDPGLKATLLAPSDAAITAFAAHACKKPADLLADKPDVLKAILLQHVVVDSVPLDGLKVGETYATRGQAGVKVESAGPVRLSVAGGVPGDATSVAERGVRTANGEGHIIAIDRVLLPPAAAFDNAQGA